MIKEKKDFLEKFMIYYSVVPAEDSEIKDDNIRKIIKLRNDNFEDVYLFKPVQQEKKEYFIVDYKSKLVYFLRIEKYRDDDALTKGLLNVYMIDDDMKLTEDDEELAGIFLFMKLL